MVKKGTENKCEQPYAGPYPFLKVNTNGTVRLKMGAVADNINIRRIEPFRDTSISSHVGECNRPVHRRDVGPRRSSRSKHPSQVTS